MEYIIAMKEIEMLEQETLFIGECCFIRVWPQKISKAPCKSIFEQIFKF